MGHRKGKERRSEQGSARPDLDHRDRDGKGLSLNDKTRTKSENI